jgi:hypothetical protein
MPDLFRVERPQYCPTACDGLRHVYRPQPRNRSRMVLRLRSQPPLSSQRCCEKLPLHTLYPGFRGTFHTLQSREPSRLFKAPRVETVRHTEEQRVAGKKQCGVGEQLAEGRITVTVRRSHWSCRSSERAKKLLKGKFHFRCVGSERKAPFRAICAPAVGTRRSAGLGEATPVGEMHSQQPHYSRC